jgi:hypothetical protein
MQRLNMIAIRSGLYMSGSQRRLSVWSKMKNLLTPDLSGPPASLQLVGATDRKYKAVGAFCDGSYGGGSESKYEEITDTDGKFIRWNGNLRFDAAHSAVTKSKGGYAAIRFDFKPPIDITDFNGYALELRSKSDVTLVLNMRCECILPNHQFSFDVKGGEPFAKLHAPFEYLIRGASGYDRDNSFLHLTALSLMVTTDHSSQGTLCTRRR